MMKKHELSRYYYLKLEIRQLEDRINEIESTVVGSSRITGMPNRKNKKSDPVERTVQLISKLKNKLENQKIKATEELIKIEDFISSVDDIDARLILTKRYIEFKKWEMISQELSICISNVYKIHRKYVERR